MTESIDKFFANIKNGETIKLPMGEFEGNFVINKPCVIIGTNTTLWSKTGPALSITVNGVKIKNLRIEAHGGNTNGDDVICINCSSNTIDTENIEVLGGIGCVDGEGDFWDLPRILNLGKFPSEKSSTFFAYVYTPVVADIKHNIKGLEITPASLKVGYNKLMVKTDCLREGTYIYGDIFVNSRFTRRISINGSVSDNLVGFVDNTTIYKSNKVPPKIKNNVTVLAASMELQRGERINTQPLLSDNVNISFEYESVIGDIDIEAYAFLLNKSGKAESDASLIFFGNEISKCGGVKYKDKTLTINLSKVDLGVNKIAIAHSIYGNNLSRNFSKVKKPIIKISSDDKVKAHFIPANLLVETTIVSIEVYRYKDAWKLSAVGLGYRDGLKRLCESYGLVVT